MTVPWILLALGVVLVLMTVPALVAVEHWAVLFPTFFVSWLGAGLAAWWLLLIPSTTIALAAAGGLERWPGWFGLVLVVVAMAGLLRQWAQARAGVRAFDTVLSALDEEARVRIRRTRRSIALPMSMRDAEVECIKGLRYADGAGARHLLDVYRPKAATVAAPVLLQIHGGAWMIGTKHTQGRPLMNALARAGWVCIAINYQLSPRVQHPEHLVDCKRALAWIRGNIAELGGDPDRIVVTGGSAGGHLAAMVALTANDPSLQPGFESVDTSVAACVPVYGAYDLEELFTRGRSWMGRRAGSVMGRLVVGVGTRTPEDRAAYRAASPMFHVTPDAPPFFLLHGTIDNLVPVAQARRLTSALHEAGVDALLVELPGAPHAFDVFHSTWADTAVDGIVRYLTRLQRLADAEAATDADSAANDPRTMARTVPS